MLTVKGAIGANHTGNVQLRLKRYGSSEGFSDLGGADGNFRVWAGGYDKENIFVIKGSNGSVGIGTYETGTHMLAVEGSIGAREIKVQATGWSDFVFEKNYNLMPLNQVENYIKENKHLPEIPTEEEVKENGINVGEMNAKLLQKIEELTLYVIELKKENLEFENRINKLEN